MKKFLIFGFAIFLVGCGTPTSEEKIENVARDENVQIEISNLETQLASGEITEKYAQEQLKKILRERKELNSGSTESILKKIEAIDPESAEMFRRQIEANQAAQ
ncbi:hypothetical protein HN954_01865 [bacterium]|nr:hypothetical protein [bacterium]